jgi:hypothetical protein
MPIAIAGPDGKAIIDSVSIGDPYAAVVLAEVDQNQRRDEISMGDPNPSISVYMPRGVPGPIGPVGPASTVAGPQGIPGIQGNTGVPSNLTIGAVTASDPGGDAEATITGIAPDKVLSLVIPRGDEGTQGIQGIQGEQGEVGDDGIQGIQGIEGTPGSNGATGAIGPTGASGITFRGEWDSATDYVNADAVFYDGATWFASGDPGVGEIPQDSSDNWFPLAIQGATGSQGEQGETGNDGVQGVQGETGNDGIQGIQGVQGEDGLKGDTGDTGATGTTAKTSVIIGDGSAITYTVTHNFNSQEVIVLTFSDEDQPPKVVDVKLPTLNTALIEFDRAPLLDSVKVVVFL